MKSRQRWNGSTWTKRAARALSLGALSCAMLAGVASSAGCVSGSKGLSDEEKARLKPYILDSAPQMPHQTNINFENRLHIVGYKVEPETAKPGQDVKITFYWRCDDSVDEGWKLFTHVHDDVADRLDNLDNIGPLRELKDDKQTLSPDRWQKGKYYVDEQTYRIPDWVKSPELSVMVGIWKGNARLRVVQGPNDGDNRAIVLKIKTGLEAPKPHTANDIPTVTVGKLAKGDKITIDGKATDAAWEKAAATGPFVDVRTGDKNTAFPVNGSAKLTWDDEALYVLFEVSDPDVQGGFTKPDDQKDRFTVKGQPKLWTKDTVEIMVDPDGDGDNKDYYELQIGPQNITFTTQYDGYNTPKTEPNGPFGHEDWDPKMKTAVVVKGSLDNPGDKDEGYVVEAKIPWKAFTKAKTSPPKSGDTWRMNFYAMQDNGGVSWSPILGKGNFHKATRFGRVIFDDGSKPAPADDAGAKPLAAPSESAKPTAAPPNKAADAG